MIKREHIREAIHAIAVRDAHIGYSLDEMLSMGIIDVCPAGGEEGRLSFLFDGEPVPVNKILFFNEGTAPIERGLLIKYGELARKQEILDQGDSLPYPEVSREIHTAGLRLLVTHELDYALARVRRRSRPGGAVEERLEALRRSPLSDERALYGTEEGSLLRGLLKGDREARFLPFPFSGEALLQLAEINLEFFHVRFVLECLVRGRERDLFACVVDRRLAGLVYLVHRYPLFGRDLEIRFLSTVRGSGQTDRRAPAPRGVGTFLLAGVWMVWKRMWPTARRIVLDSEVGARGFYGALGFQPVGPSAYHLRDPEGPLIDAILDMARSCKDLDAPMRKALERVIGRLIRGLRRGRRAGGDDPERRSRVAAVKACLLWEGEPGLGIETVSLLVKHRKEIPETDAILAFGSRHGSDLIKATIHALRTRFEG